MSNQSPKIFFATTQVLNDHQRSKVSENPAFAFKSDIPYGNNANKTITAPSSVLIDSSANGLVFNFVPGEVINEIEDESNWRNRVLAIHKLEGAFDAIEDIDKVIPFLSMFVRFIAKLIQDKNFKVSEGALNLCLKIIDIPRAQNFANLTAIIQPCILKLGDNKISIRMLSFKILKGLLGILRPEMIIEALSQGLEIENWHVKEEICGLIIAAVLSNIPYEYSDLIEPIAKLLDDTRPKVRIVAVEALAVLDNKAVKILPALEHLLDEKALETIKQRLSQGQIAKIIDDYIEYPKSSFLLFPRIIHYATDAREEILSARVEEKMPAAETPRFVGRPITQLSEVKEISKSQVSLPRKLTPIESRPEAESYYLPDNELTQVKQPHEKLQKIMNGVSGWEDQFQAINTLRRLTKFHSEVFFSKVTLHNVVLDVVKWADSLRSSLAKNALILLQDMCNYLRKSMDTEISELIKILLKKTNDTNSFISEQGKKTLDTMLNCLSEQKVLPFVLFHAQNAKKSGIKAQIAFCFGKIVKKARDNFSRLRDFDKVLQILAEYVTDAALEVREAARIAWNEFFAVFRNEGDADLLLIRALKDPLYHKVQMFMEKKTRSVSPIKSNSEVKLKMPNFKLRKYFPKFVIKQGTNSFAETHSKIQSSDWKTRYDSVTSLSLSSKDSTPNLNQTEHIINTISAGLSDSHIKVQVHTLSTLKKLIPLIQDSLTPYLPLLFTDLKKSLNVANTNMRESAGEAIMLLVDHCDGESLSQNLVETIKNSRSRGKVYLYRGLLKLLNKKPPENLQEIFLSSCEDLKCARAEVREECSKTLKKLHSLNKELLIKHAPESQLDSLRQILTID
ncbi:hypothetical protein SteCoe_12500 [Stentor coeruleus]|uniref:TOG domain-containing protein n=1 Tax=Stentor coeruleus TaxID=5963 RepID=A0A1R2CAM4_9CILI|nr:hypothetical protein SteCoe_12500 [Stentor coeruleus]